MSDPRNAASPDAIRLINKRISGLRSESMALLKTSMVNYRSNKPTHSVGNTHRTTNPLEEHLLENTIRIDELYRLLNAINTEAMRKQEDRKS